MALRAQRGMVNIGQLLDRKYDIMQQEADARTMGAKRQFVGGAGSPIAPGAVLGFGMVDSGGADFEDPTVTELRRAQIAQTNALTKNAQLTGIAAQQDIDQAGTSFVKGVRPGSEAPRQVPDWLASAIGAKFGITEPVDPDKQDIGGQAKGIAKVPGKGDGTVDKVKAKLAPGEAVLNKEAAETLGRGMIKLLNKMGAQKMGMI